MSIFSRILNAGEGRTLRTLETLAAEVGTFEEEMAKRSDAELVSLSESLRSRVRDGASLDSIEAEAYALVRETAKRVLGQRPFDAQVIGAGALHRGNVAEMKTGEGKTLAATMPAYLNALEGKGVHIVTVNDYLAARDAEWMGRIHRFLGLTVGLIQSGMTPAERWVAYAADVTYGTNNEFGFDYLRDNMATSVSERTQRGHHFAIVDEVDSILIDEARTPLIIAGAVAGNAKWYRQFAKIVLLLKPEIGYEVDEGKQEIYPTEEGIELIERTLGISNLYDHAATDLVHHLDAALKAQVLFKRDVDYLVENGEVKIVDEFTGRVLEGRRFSEGLHQAIEAKEGVKIKDENQTMATITLQNYFRMYDKLSGMTGTAKTEAAELAQIYGLSVIEIGTNRPIVRADQPDVIYKTEAAKFAATIDDIAERHAAGQPVLVGTISIEKSERVDTALTRRGVPHQVLNAKHHAKEAAIIAQAGRFGAVTVATNMAGRGVDIMLGGNPEALAAAKLTKRGLSADDDGYAEAYAGALVDAKAETDAERLRVLDAGGLYVVGTERHESRRIDNQLRGRSGRQGDPGESRFFLSLEDDLMRMFAADRVTRIMETLRIPEDVPIEAKMVAKSIERAQAQVESQHFDMRKNVLKYDEVMNRQREIVYAWRDQLLNEDNPEPLLLEWCDTSIAAAVAAETGELADSVDWDWDAIARKLGSIYPSTISKDSFAGSIDAELAIEAAQTEARAFYDARKSELGASAIADMAKVITVAVIDNNWRDHLATMDYLRTGIGLRAMGQRDPLVEYQKEGYDLFADMVDTIKLDTVRYLFRASLAKAAEHAANEQRRIQAQAANAGGGDKRQAKSTKVGRNQPCPCGSGKKYKHCHGARNATV